MAITQSILRIALDTAQKNDAKRVLAINLKLGEFSDVLPRFVQTCLDAMSEGSIAQGAIIKETRVPASVRCRACGAQSVIDRQHIFCPQCKSTDIALLSGTECIVESVEVE